MDEGETVTEPQVPELCRKDLRKQKLMEYLAAKGRLKPPNSKPYLRGGQLEAKKPAMSTVKPDSAKSKENQPPNAASMRNDAQKVQPQTTKGASQPSKTNILGLSANAAQTRKYTIASLKSNLNATNKPKMQLDMGIKPTVRPSSSKSLSNIPKPTTSQPNYQASYRATRAAKSGLQVTFSSRMSLGPLAKTRTGLIPAILQPRTTIPTATTTKLAASSTANRGHSNNTTRLVSSVAQKSTVARGKPVSFTVGLKHTRTTATGASVAGIKTKTLNKTISKPPVKSLKPSLQNRTPTAFKATSTRSTAAATKPHQNETETKSIKSVQLSKKASVHRSGVGGTGNAPPQKVGSGGFSGAGGQRQNTASNRTTRTAELKEKDEVHRGADNKSAVDSTKESRQKGPPTAFKATCVSTRPTTTAPAKPEQKARVPKYAKSVQPSKKASEHRSGVEGTGNNPRSQKVGAGGTSKAGQRQNTVLKRATHTAELTEKDRVDGGASDNKREECTSTKRAGVPYVPQTVPRRAKSLSLVQWATDTKTPRAQATVMPQTEKHNLTAAQEERMRKLREWRESKGISYKRPPMQVRPPPVRHTVAVPQPYWTNMDDDDDTRALICAVDRSLADCVKLLEEGCLPEQVVEHLSRLPAMAQKFAKYWICQARLMERQGNLEVLPMFEEAVRVVLEPVDGLRDVVFDILKKKDDIQGRACTPQELQEESPIQGQNCSEAVVTPTVTPNPVRARIYSEKSSSSMVKYKVTSTPTPSRKQREPVRVNGQEVRFITPVRRSVRIEGGSLRYPASLQDHDVCVASYNDLMVQEEQEEDGDGEAGGASSPSIHGTPMYVYMENQALKDKVHVQLFTNDED